MTMLSPSDAFAAGRASVRRRRELAAREHAEAMERRRQRDILAAAKEIGRYEQRQP